MTITNLLFGFFGNRGSEDVPLGQAPFAFYNASHSLSVRRGKILNKKILENVNIQLHKDISDPAINNLK